MAELNKPDPFFAFQTTSWILDIDTTIKPIYGHQQGATLGYNPHKPGRPSHAYHSHYLIWIATARRAFNSLNHKYKLRLRHTFALGNKLQLVL